MNFLFIAYAVIWLLLFGYVMSISGKQKRLDQELDALRQVVREKTGDESSANR